MGPGHSAAKTALRDQVLAARKRRPLEAAGGFAASVADAALAWEPVRSAATVAAYVSVGSEPGTGLLLDVLAAAGKRVLLPVVLPGLDLDWAEYTGREGLAPAVRGLLEPTAPRLGREAIAQADVVLVPGTGVSLSGARLGQGGGCYDRALPRVSPGTPVAVVLYDDEVGLAVPAEPHDVRVGFALTSHGVRALLESPDIR
ncbi:5-formyltetrahydrofolate cyclo-ligase [Nocardioides cavernae]|uniref:5-formyltetrahydrofolate cyclo-ligase n=1 Tax=Nocardioides cavernae TaxID=1921566 RepID=A0ABR8N818_9ACTN|nr:5-formyltetrahydrofolate cyclo-ligase [Nocardioides cavernae]MBD3923376.1 5-formyltetrahydrofolate cyclo-ligase [Nocardioides cavernae]MBM7511701.1 5-formyltetrahydrofolate cyclo-ligase [Nocardioides cavernae]